MGVPTSTIVMMVDGLPCTDQFVVQSSVEPEYTVTMNKTETGQLQFLRSVRVSQKGGSLRQAFTAEADVYSFVPDNVNCKVTYLASVRGVDHEVMCGSSGAVGKAILVAANLTRVAKNAGIASAYVTFPEPIGCPATRLLDRSPSQSLAFYRKA